MIVGAGLAGARCAEALRTAGHPGRIVLLGEEPHAPYERPALSKDVLTGARDGPALRLRTQVFWDERRIELRPGCAVDELDLEGRRVTADGDVVGFEHLVLATGLRARRLPALPDGPGVHALRTLDDARAAPPRAAAGRPTHRVGCGLRRPRGRFERDRARCERDGGRSCRDAVPPDPRARGRRPAREPRPRARCRAAPRAHRGRGRAQPGSSTADGRRSTTARAAPATSSSSGSGRSRTPSSHSGQLDLADDGGIATDAAGRTGIAGVYACGDVASRPYAGQPDTLRLEHWGAAASSARAVASAITGMPLPRRFAAVLLVGSVRVAPAGGGPAVRLALGRPR